jgi:hypothetical protein
MTETGRRAIFVGGQKGWMESTDTGFTAAARRGRSSRQSKALAKEGTADTRVRGTCLSSQVAGARAGATESLTVTAAVKCLLRTVTTTTTLTLALTPKLGPVKDLEVLVLTLGSLVLRLTPALSLQLQVLRAWSHLDPDLALAQARALDAVAVDDRGPLHGVPVGVKDIIDTADQPTSYGSPIYAGHRPQRDAACVARLREAGAVIIGASWWGSC